MIYQIVLTQSRVLLATQHTWKEKRSSITYETDTPAFSCLIEIMLQHNLLYDKQIKFENGISLIDYLL